MAFWQGARLEQDRWILNGRVGLKRDASKKLIFFDLLDADKCKLQIMCAQNRFISPEEETSSSNASYGVAQLLRKGDFVSVEGFVGATNTGELTLVANHVTMLAPCLREIPEVFEDHIGKARNRHLDFLVNDHHLKTFKTRAKIINTLRRFLADKEGMLEVETPVLWTSHGGEGFFSAPFSSW